MVRLDKYLKQAQFRVYSFCSVNTGGAILLVGVKALPVFAFCGSTALGHLVNLSRITALADMFRFLASLSMSAFNVGLILKATKLLGVPGSRFLLISTTV